MNHWIAYTDGSTRMNGTDDAQGGWGVYWNQGPIYSSQARPLLGKATNNRAELTAVLWTLIYSLSYISLERLDIHTDSTYVIKCWMNGPQWKINNKTYPNADLVDELIRLKQECITKNITVDIIKVPAHKDNVGNNIADRLATWGADNPTATNAEHEMFVLMTTLSTAPTLFED